MKKYTKVFMVIVAIILLSSIAFAGDDHTARPDSIGEPLLLMFLNNK